MITLPQIPIYCNSLTSYERFRTREVMIGDLALGGDNPIRLQSMTTTDTLDTAATVAQSIRMIEAGCELVRITAPSIKEAQNLENIRRELRAKGYNTPLVADIHFTPNAAELAARIVEKVRVNPGNYADKKKFEHIEYTDSTYEAELDRIRERFTPLVKICKEYGTAMRIGTNHGSLSDRIMSRYGDSPLGMVESAMEFLMIAEENNFYNLVLSMKSSNTQVMVQAYRLLVKQMMEKGMNYPLHLGVTEAGEGEDGRIKSAVGIGTLLEDGLGDTIRVSLTEEPEFEIPVARALVQRYANREKHANIPAINQYPIDPFNYSRRTTLEAGNIGGENVPRVVMDFSQVSLENPAVLYRVGYAYSVPMDKWNLTDLACDFIFSGTQIPAFELPGTLGVICDESVWTPGKFNLFPLIQSSSYKQGSLQPNQKKFIAVEIQDFDQVLFDKIKLDPSAVLVCSTQNAHAMAELRRIVVYLEEQQIKTPVIIRRSYDLPDLSTFQLAAATDFGGLLIDGLGDGIWLDATNDQPAIRETNQTAFGILQAARVRISRTEYISCPSCGRTLFDLQETTAKIRKRTDHLKGLKIGIMGCIVNGPGEMADADFGYVGTGIGKITLYKGKEVVKRNVPAENAVDELIQLIKDHGKWVDFQA
ncbi:MAG TPA: (E)-4-hydroxy-3-methylbut-2-enyl-diphosphate synthase [Flavobacteriales bacterium]|nr:(E)-4-hydroxy-3-methylbut-2-enyl-diphosphate synthase [Flavobacteriales bacterium]